MRIKGIIDEDFVNYRVPSMMINTSTCSFKCDEECGRQVCQNSSLAKAQTIDVSEDSLIRRYLSNKITKAICFGGLEPLDQWHDIYNFIYYLRNNYKCKDTVVIYTGYKENEVEGILEWIRDDFENIVIKFGRFIPDQEKHYDKELGVYLASPNQYAKRIC